MRQLAVLIVGLLLIGLWGLGLRSVVRGTRSKEPERIPASSHAKPLSSQSSRTTQDGFYQANPDLQRQRPQSAQSTQQNVVPAAAWQPAPQGSSAAIASVVDTLNPDARLVWTYSELGPGKPLGESIYLSKREFELKLAVTGSPANVQFNTSSALSLLAGDTDATQSDPAIVSVTVAVTDSALNTFDLSISSDLDPATSTLQITIDVQSGREFQIATADPKVDVPFISAVRTGEHHLFRSPVTDKIGLARGYSHRPQIRLRPNGRLNEVVSIVSRKNGDSWHVERVAHKSFGSDEEQTVTLPELATSKEDYIVAVCGVSAFTGNPHRFASSPVEFALADNQFSAATIAFKATSTLIRNRNKNQAIEIEYELSGNETARGGTLSARLFYNNRVASDPITLGSAANGTMNFESGLDIPDGIGEVEVRLYDGARVLAQDTQLVDSQTDGFTVDSVGPSTVGRELGSKEIRLEFSHQPQLKSQPGTPVAADAAAAFTLIHSPSGDFDSGQYAVLNQTTDYKFKAGLTPKQLTITLEGSHPLPGRYRIQIRGSILQDVYENPLVGSDGQTAGTFIAELGSSPAEQDAAGYPVIRGVNPSKAPFVEYPDFVDPRPSSKGFNPSDKVETRVARLYFFRDAHRVAQILNRKVQSYNRQEVSVRRQLADKARQKTDAIITERQISERAAVEAAKRTRELENQLSDTQRSLDFTLQELRSASLETTSDAQDESQKRAVIGQLENAARSFADQAQTLESQVRAARDQEIAANERWQQAEREEQLARTDQFRLETAAAHADPDTFAAGDPKSIDPVAQVSISVIGEGLLHLRGPLKGVNQVRIMVDQIDSPQGQVRINVHSTQINGDEADKLEVVANRIQTYIDQARFLTVQSAEVLRKSVVHVAAMQAEQVRELYPGIRQAERDQLYLHAFFGRDFIAELQSMDSELLHTGNKLLSLHSMDVTSLSGALMLLALANNETRLAILQEFQGQLQTSLAHAEMEYIRNGIGCCQGGCKLGCKHHSPSICAFAQNATFTSLRGFFDANIAHADTMNPLQREMIRLAQILKARLVTEMEYKQRVMERSVIEERLGEVETSTEQVKRERETLVSVRQAQEAQLRARAMVLPSVAKSMSILDQGKRVVEGAREPAEAITRLLAELLSSRSEVTSAPSLEAALIRVLALIDDLYKYRIDAVTRLEQSGDLQVSQGIDLFRDQVEQVGFDYRIYGFPDSKAREYFFNPDGSHSDLTVMTKDSQNILYVHPSTRQEVVRQLNMLASQLQKVSDTLVIFRGEQNASVQDITQLTEGIQRLDRIRVFGDSKDGFEPVAPMSEIRSALVRVIRLVQASRRLAEEIEEIETARRDFLLAFGRFDSNSERSAIDQGTEIYEYWTRYASRAKAIYSSSVNNSQKNNTTVWLDRATESLESWLTAVSKLDAANALARQARRPLDHKKFLDMLIDDLEEKYIELLEGTRAHTANIDNYLKRLTTSLDDDFNTQFYNPAFRLIRETSQSKRVEFGQTETTNVLVNNRQFGKVSPAATMEFDLPERDILIAEGLDSAMAIYNDVGALINDPNLLALAKSQAGGSVASAAAGTLGGRGAVRSVLPGLDGSTSEQLLAQNAGSGPEFESNVEKLIPDPAIYKFETGTGYEVRPVIAPDGQAVVFDFHYLYTTQIREPVRADEKHLGRVKQHFIDTDVQLSNFELREISRYVVALKAERTANGVPLLEDIPVVGVLWRPLPNREKSLQQNIIMSQATIFPTLFDLMGLRWAPAVADLDPLRMSNREYLVRGRHKFLENRIYDYSSSRVDEFLRIPESARRADLYRSQETIPSVHPNGYRGPGLDLQNSQMEEGYDPEEAYARPGYIPSSSPEGALYLPHRQNSPYHTMPRGTLMFEENSGPNELPPREQRATPPQEIIRTIRPTYPGTTGSMTPPQPHTIQEGTYPGLGNISGGRSSRQDTGWEYEFSDQGRE